MRLSVYSVNSVCQYIFINKILLIKQINQREITLYIFLNTNNSNRTNNKKWTHAPYVRTCQLNPLRMVTPLNSKLSSFNPQRSSFIRTSEPQNNTPSLFYQLSTLIVPRSSELPNLRTSEQAPLSQLSSFNVQLSTLIVPRSSPNSLYNLYI